MHYFRTECQVLIFSFILLFLNSCGGGSGTPTIAGDTPTNSISESQMTSKLEYYTQFHQTTVLLHEISTPLGEIFRTKAAQVEWPCGVSETSLPVFTKNADNSFSLSKNVTVDLCTSSSTSSLSTPTTIIGTLTIKLSISDFKLSNDFLGSDIDLSGKKILDTIGAGTRKWKQIHLKLSIIHSGTVEETGLPETRSVGFKQEIYEMHSTLDPNKPCVFSSNIFTNCTITIVDEIVSQTPSLNYSDKLVFKYGVIDLTNFTGQFRSNYFPNGKLDFNVNDWTGQLIFSDNNTPPNYTASNGNTNVAGKLAYCLEFPQC